MVELKSIEQLLYFMKGHIQLSRYDEKFIENISSLSTVTTNQVILFHKLISKYRRQFFKHELFVEKLLELPWSVTVVESSPQYTDGHITIIDDVIYFRCPFNRNFIDEFRKVNLNSFVWNKVKRYYESPFNIYSLKILLGTAKRFFQNINYCDHTKSILEQLEPYKDVKYWQPTLIERNGNLFIAASNNALEDALGELKLSFDDTTLLTLSKYGVTIDEVFYKDNPKLKFICEYSTTIEQNDILKLIEWLLDIKCDMVILSGINSTNPIKKKFIEELVNNNLPYCDIFFNVPKTTKNYDNAVYVKFKKNGEGSSDIIRPSKIITITNSNSIEIK